MYGLVLIVNMFGREQTFKEEQRWKILLPVVQMCVPEDRKSLLEEKLKEHEAESWNEIGWELVNRLLGNTFALGIGFVVHVLAS